MPYYHECPVCGLNLDPGEICDCTQKSAPSVEPLRAESPAKAKIMYTMLIISHTKEKVNHACKNQPA